MAGDMWDGGLEEGGFASLRQFITGLPQAKWRCWGGVGWSRVKYIFEGIISQHTEKCITQCG